MALVRILFTSSFNALCRHNLNLLGCLLPRYTSKNPVRNSPQNSAIDVYTENLVLETANKWSECINNLVWKRSKQYKLNNNSCYNGESLKKLSIDELQSKIIESINNCDLKGVLFVAKFCNDNSYSLHSGFIISIAKLFAKLGNKELVELAQALLKISNESEFNSKCGLQYYTAQVLWYNGNPEDALNILERLYLIDSLKHDVNLIVRDLLCDAVVKNEASLVMVTRFAQRLVDMHNNYYPISILWKNLIESEWFADHQLADELLLKNKELKIIISPLVPLWCIQLIQYHKIDAVHKMSEVLLENNYHEYYSSVLHTLFDYYYRRNNLRMCSAVVKSATDLQIPLKHCYQKRFLVLLTTGKADISKQNKLSSDAKRLEKLINYRF